MRLGLFQGKAEKGLSRIYPFQAKRETGSRVKEYFVLFEEKE
jgi:hypothetical protein